MNVEIKGKLRFVGFIDVIIRNIQSGRIKIIDIKTSTRGWRDKEKKNKTKTSQLLLYKHFYSQKYNVPIDTVDVEYFIVKRKLWENADFPQRRVQLFSPASGTLSVKRTLDSLSKFVFEAFDDEGKKYDAAGNLNNWWTENDTIRFNKKTTKLKRICKQY